MKDKNAAEISRLDAVKKDAVENLGETEVREALLAKAEYYSKIGAKAEAETAFRETYEKTSSLGQRMDILFNLVRIGFFFFDKDLISRNLDKADTLLAEGGDWDRRNRLKVYRGFFSMCMRDFSKASSLFLETVSTFTSGELMEYRDFVVLAVLVSLPSLSRPDLFKKVVKGPEIQEQLHDLPVVKALLMSLYECNYSGFFRALVDVDDLLRHHRFLSVHRQYYVRELRILAYNQLMESYRSVTLESMAKSFGVSVDFIDRELSRFVTLGRLHCKIDRVGGIVETNRPDVKNAQYQSTLKQGDALLNRLQKLGQVINI